MNPEKKYLIKYFGDASKRTCIGSRIKRNGLVIGSRQPDSISLKESLRLVGYWWNRNGLLV